AVLVLTPPRSGSTLLRVMLAGHSRVFAPPELELLAFQSLGRRREAYSGRNRFAREGLVRAVMELEGCDADRAWELLRAREDEDEPVASVYRWLQERIGGRLLVDKTPSYALLPETLARAEALFRDPLYVHLARHPRGTVDSYVEARMDRVYPELPDPPRRQAELVWRLAHRNVLDFLAGVPEERWIRLRFEDLVRTPEESAERLCRFLGLELEPDVLEPYRGSRMTDGLRAGTRMMGDPKFHEHRGVDPSVADRWRMRPDPVPLARESVELAGTFGYAAGEDLPEAPPLAPRAAEGREADAAPLSYAQERLWFLTELEPVSAAYNMPAAVALEGRLDAPALARSFAHALERHEVLRTAFPAVDGRPRPAVAPPGQVPLPVVDLSRLGSRREAEALRLARQEGAQAFDLSRGPMLRTALVRRTPDDHLLLVTMHHIASDGWSIGVLIRELAVAYAAIRRGERPSLPPLPVQYADYAAWQRRWLGEGTLGRHLDYWRRLLAGPLPPVELPADRPRPPVQRFRGGRRSGRLSPEATETVKAWSRRRGTTPFLTLLAAFDALLHRYTGQDDLLLGIPVANRNRVEVEGLIGFFLNMVVQRADASGAPPFGELLERVSRGFLESTPHHEVPFEKVVEAVQPVRDRSRSPIFQIQFSLQNTPAEPLELPGLHLEPLEIHNGTTKFDLTVFLFDEAEGLRTTLEYDRDLFDGATVERLLAHWHTLLLGAVEDPDRTLPELPLLRPAERAQAVHEWNDPLAAYRRSPALHRLFELQAAERGDAPAVVHELDELSYRELDRRAGTLAAHLSRLGVGPEVPVGIALDRSVELVVAVLGVLKTGGAYVPLDPDHPRERIDLILEDVFAGAGPAVVVTRERFAELVRGGDGDGRRLVLVDSLPEAPEEPVAPAPAAGPDQLAYVIFTSGSTGRPKGVQVTHGDVVRLLRATEKRFAFGPGDVWTLFHSYAFDFSVWELWGALAYGGTLVVVSGEVARSPSAFYELLATEGVTVLNQTPSAFRQLVAVEEEEGPRDLELRWVVFGGEALDLPALDPWIEHHGDRRPGLVNMYGITETTVHVTHRRIRARDLERPWASPVGGPIPDLRAHLLGPRMEPVPTGADGEIHVGGAGLARGYLRRPALTAERFVPDPWAGTPGGRLYRSGDLARRAPGGDLLYRGRIDHQVKVRGFRIELGEIEAALTAHPRVAEAVVTPRDGADPEDRRLVGYVVPRPGPRPAADELRRHLEGRLPDYMVPSGFVTLETLPTGPTGKVDRRALPAPEDSRPELETGFVAPRTRTERRLAAIWCEVLRVDRVGAEDDFFDLGGHSLLATQLASRIRGELGVELPVAAVLEHTRLDALAAHLDRLLPEEDESGAEPSGPPPLEPQPRDGEIPLSYAQERLWFVEELEGERSQYRVPLALDLEGPLDAPALHRAVAEIVRRHEALRTTFPSRGGRPCQLVHPPRRPPLPLVDLQGLAPRAAREEEERLIRLERSRPFDLAAGPLLRTVLVRTGGERHLLLATMHHLVSDGWSLGVFLREAVTLYDGFVRGEPAALPELEVQYADFAVWQRRWLDGEALQAEIDHWLGRLEGAAPLELPTDRRPRPGQAFRAGDLPLELDEEAVDRLEALAHQHGASLYMVLLAVFQLLLARHTGQEDVVVGSPVANRNHRGVEELIGFFVNTLVLRSDLSGRPTFRQALDRVRETALDAFEHQDLPFARLVEALRPDRRSGTTPLVQAMFTLHNHPIPELKLGRAAIRPRESWGRDDARTAFALSVRLWHEGGRLVGGFGYNRSLLDPTTAKRWRRHFLALLDGVLDRPDAPAAGLPLLAAGERQQVTVEWPFAAEAEAGGIPCPAEPLEGSDRPAPIGVWGVAPAPGAGEGAPARE
ncbi:MAG: amino acid adenylation domain-containing protein, partial [Thermoanaerobaculia bacterium]